MYYPISSPKELKEWFSSKNNRQAVVKYALDKISKSKEYIERYNIVIENYKRGYYKKPHRITDEFFALSGEMVKLFGEIRKIVE